MTKLPNGLYDLLITREIDRELTRLGSERIADAEPLEPADANVLLARHIAAVVREGGPARRARERTSREAGRDLQ